MIIATRTLSTLDSARHLPGWQVIYVIFERVVAEECDSSESADRVASGWEAQGVTCTVLHDGNPTT